MKLPWVKNTEGKPDAMLSFAVVAFAICCFKVLFGDIKIEMMGRSFSFGAIDATIIGAMLTPTLGSYVMRRWTDKKTKQEAGQSNNSPSIDG